MLKIAVIGAGLAGLAAGYNLSKKHTVTLFDRAGAGSGASGVATGLLHPFAGARSKLNWKGKEGLSATLSLIDEVQPFVDNPILLQKGITRLGYTEESLIRYKTLSEQEENVRWMDRALIESKWLYLNPASGIFIDCGYSIDTPTYLRALKLACIAQGVSFLIQEIHSLKELAEFDKIIVAAGAWCKTIDELKEVPLKQNKGQLLRIFYPKIKEVFNAKGYIVPIGEGELILGTSYEKSFTTEKPDLDIAKKEIYPLVKEMISNIDQGSVLECRASLRASSPDHLPIFKEISPNVHLFAGLGSKGLLYHALFARSLIT